MKTILVAVDGSDHSQRATDLAADIATKYDAKLLLLNVIDNRPLSDAERQLAEAEFGGELERRMEATGWPDITPAGSRGMEPLFQKHSEATLIIRTTIGEGLLEAAKREASAKGATDIETLLENGDPADVILKVSEDRDANLIVLGSRGQSDVKSLFLGSVSHKVANQSEISVITVK